MGFWHVYLGIYGGGGDAEATEPTDGWVAATRTRHFVPETRNRLLITEAKTRLWIARTNNE